MYQNGTLIDETWVMAILLLLIVIGGLNVVLGVIYRNRQKMLQIRQSHEIAVMEKKFEQKKAIDELLKQERDNEWIEEKNEMKKHLDELWKKRNETTPLDIKRVALLYLVLSGKNVDITTENLDKEMEKIENAFEMVKKYIKD